jgi:hypothetical protein
MGRSEWLIENKGDRNVTRELIRFMTMVVSIGIATGHLGLLHGVASAQVTTSSQAVVQDNFDDNKTGTLWKAYTEGTGKAAEVNKHVEFTTTSATDNAFAGYMGDKWSIDPNHDFAMKVDLNYDMVTMNGGWVTFGVTPSPDKPRNQYVAFGIGCVSTFRSYWREWKDGYEVRWTFQGRNRNLTTLYFSYDADADTLYMGEAGYGADNAWEVVADQVRGRWGRKPIYVFLGLTTEGVAVGAGHAFVDNFALESGVLTNAKPSTPPDPNNKPPEGGESVDVAAEISILPSVIKRLGPAEPITSFLSLPRGLLPVDVDETQPIVLTPGGAQATKRTTFLWLTGQVIVVASFDRAKLLETVTTNGDVSLQVAGRLKDGRYFGGTDAVRIE